MAKTKRNTPPFSQLLYDRKQKRWILTSEQLGHLMDHVEKKTVEETTKKIVRLLSWKQPKNTLESDRLEHITGMQLLRESQARSKLRRV